MKKDYKRVLMYGLIMFVCVVLLVLSVVISQKKISGYENTFQQISQANQESIKILEEEIAVLEKENKELQTKLTQAMEQNSDTTTQGQALADLKGIYETYKSGKADEAKAQFKKIEPMGFDDATLAYYEILKDILEK